jgi:GntR family transcriptional regulator
MKEPGRLLIQIDTRSGVPAYRQIMDQIKYYVASGVLKPETQVPSIRQLAVELALNPTTIVKAYTELEHEGVIAVRHGKGAFIAEGAQRMNSRERQDALRRMARQIAVESAQMGISGQEVVRAVTDALREVTGGRSMTDGRNNH